MMETVSKNKISLKEQIDIYNERVREVLHSYYHRNKDDSEPPIEICVIHDSMRLIDRLVEENADVNKKLQEAYAIIDRFVGD